MKRAIAIVIMFCLANETVKANEIELGFAAAYSNNGIESDNQLYPYISYSNDTFYFEGTSMGLYLTEGDVGDYLFYDVSTFISYEPSRTGILYNIDEAKHALALQNPYGLTTTSLLQYWLGLVTNETVRCAINNLLS